MMGSTTSTKDAKSPKAKEEVKEAKADKPVKESVAKAEKVPARSEEDRLGDSLGITSKKGVVFFWSKLLDENTALFKAGKKPLTDEELIEELKKEFPKREKFQPASRIRSWYNHGRYKLGNGDDTKKEGDEVSVEYGADSKPKKGAKKEKAEKAPKTEKVASKTNTKPADKSTKPAPKLAKDEDADDADDADDDDEDEDGDEDE